MRINIYNIINSKNALLHDDGLLVFSEAQKLYEKNHRPIEIDFKDVNRLSTLFLNASFGKLLAKYGTEVTRHNFQPSNYTQISSFMDKFNDMWDNFENRENYQAYRELDFA